MKKYILGFSSAMVIVLALVIASLVFAQGPANNQPGDSSSPSSQTPAGSDSNPVGTPEVIIPEEYRPQAGSAPQAGSPTSVVYFTPQDENTSTTILFLYSTNPVTSTVGIQSFYINGSLTISTSVSVPPMGLLRISADPVTTVSASWSKYVQVNFTTFSAYGKLILPPGIKADGYVAWDTTGIYDPLAVDQVLPLRFSIDPPTVFLPTVQH